MNATRKVVLVAGVVVCLAVLLWIRAGRPMPAGRPSQVATASEATASAMPPAVYPISSKTKPAPKADERGEAVEICGVGKVRLPADDADGQEYMAILAERTVARWTAALRASSDLRARAVGLMLMRPDQSEALAGLALQTDDPALYAMALNACGRAEQPSAACTQISPEAWAQLDADNAVAWLEVAQRLRRGGDTAGERAAMARAATAHRVENYNFSLWAYTDPSLPADARYKR